MLGAKASSDFASGFPYTREICIAEGLQQATQISSPRLGYMSRLFCLRALAYLALAIGLIRQKNLGLFVI